MPQNPAPHFICIWQSHRNMLFKDNYIPYIVFLCLFVNIMGCTTDNFTENDNARKSVVANDSTSLNIAANKWIHNTMNLYYYWAEDMPKDMEYLYSMPPQDFFTTLLHNNDRFSWISTTKESNDKKIYGGGTNRGFECAFLYSDSTQFNLIGEIIYTIPGSQAEANGIKRGMFFKEINGTSINISNYEELLSIENANYQFIFINAKSVSDTLNVLVTMDSVQPNPILASKMTQYNGHNIGYICYRQFINDNGDGSEQYKRELIQLFSSFRKQGVSDIVLDLRYNTGGDINLSVLLGSMLVPRNDTTQTALKIRYNEKLTNAYLSMGYVLSLNFSCNDDCYVGDMINNVIILTGPNTASASEDLINMLLPYRKPVIIGTKTYGKNYGSQVFSSSNTDITWVLQPITMKIFNCVDSSDFDNGFIPDYYINEINFPMKEFGAVDEPLMGKALEVITNTSNIAETKGSVPQNVCNSNLKLWKYNINIEEEYSNFERQAQVCKSIQDD